MFLREKTMKERSLAPLIHYNHILFENNIQEKSFKNALF